LRVVLPICILCLVLAVYAGHRIIADTDLDAGRQSPLVRSQTISMDRDDAVALEPRQPIPVAGSKANPNVWSNAFNSVFGASHKRIRRRN
jgi:hypothetical protein